MARPRTQRPTVIAVSDDTLFRRARKLRQKGDLRGATVALREACLRDEENAVAWTLYGALLAMRGRVDEAKTALRHAVWLRRGAGDAPRVRTTEALLEGLCPVAA